MALNIKNAAVERLVSEISRATGETKTEAIKKALEERQHRLGALSNPRRRREHLRRVLEEDIWSEVPRKLLGRRLSKSQLDEILGFGPSGV
jgi:antitoxin VapB